MTPNGRRPAPRMCLRTAFAHVSAHRDCMQILNGALRRPPRAIGPDGRCAHRIMTKTQEAT